MHSRTRWTRMRDSGHAHSLVLRGIREEGKEGGSERATMQCHVAFFLPLFLFVSRFVLPSLPSSHCGPNTNAPRPPPPMSLVGMFSRIISRISRLLYLCPACVRCLRPSEVRRYNAAVTAVPLLSSPPPPQSTLLCCSTRCRTPPFSTLVSPSHSPLPFLSLSERFNPSAPRRSSCIKPEKHLK